MTITVQNNKQFVPITELTLWDKNPRSIQQKDFQRLKKQIQKRGQYKPLIVNQAGVVIGGNMRLRAFQELGISQAWVSIIATKDKNEDMEISLSDNDRAGYYDLDLFANIYHEYDVEWGDYAMDWRMPETTSEIISRFSEATEDVPPAVEENPKSESGAMYQLGEHRVLCGDATKQEDVARLMGGQMATMLFSSPPYNMAANLYKNYKDKLKSDEYIQFNIETIKLWKAYLKGFVFWNISYNRNARWEFIEIMYRMIKETGLTFMELIVWNKGHGMPITSKDMLTRQYEDIVVAGDEASISVDMELLTVARSEKQMFFHKQSLEALTNYWYIPTNDIQSKDLAACFPVGLPYKAIKIMTRPDDIIVDPFGGSGTTLIAAEQLHRRCFMMELDPRYVDVIRKRYARAVGQEDIWQHITPAIV